MVGQLSMLFCLRADVSNKPEEFRDFGQSFKVTQQGKANTYGKRAGISGFGL